MDTESGGERERDTTVDPLDDSVAVSMRGPIDVITAAAPRVPGVTIAGELVFGDEP